MALLCGLLTGLAVLVLLGRPGAGRLQDVVTGGRPAGGRRAGGRRTSGGRAARPTTGPPAPSRTPLLASLLAGAALVLLVPSPLGPLLAGAAAVAGPRLLGRLEPGAVRAQRERLLADLPLLLDLLASCLAGGAPLPEAARAVAGALPGPAGERLSAVAALLAVGAPPRDAWSALAGGRDDDPLAPAARALGRAADGGAPVATAVGRLAADARAQARSAGEQAARRVGVLVVAPLGLCFLPAFVLLGVVPVVAGLAGPLLSGS